MTDRIQQLTAMLQEEPNDTFCMYGLAMEYARQDDLQRAIAWFDRTIETDPDYCYAYFHKAKCQERANQISDAQNTLRQGLQRAHDVGDAKAASEIAALLDELS